MKGPQQLCGVSGGEPGLETGGEVAGQEVERGGGRERGEGGPQLDPAPVLLQHPHRPRQVGRVRGVGRGLHQQLHLHNGDEKL